ncbi:LIN1-like protein [Diplogelasinospora grovesii]|uniref:LIN1-like protein n=1 Tax=Diplogelasinospora grovesii TaxID=303347 RepID=A0AAN6SAB4_9PEZI|nr:LIN1-like protein [Diplogelasinospora grovesii]
MSSRYAAARPKRAGESFARTHHGDRGDESNGAGPASSKKVKFDVRNPSALAPGAHDDDDRDEEDDLVLAADVIGKSGRGATKRGAVNIDGYDSDSDNDNLEARAEDRKRKGKDAEDVDLAEAMDNYNSKKSAGGGAADKDDDDDDEIDMFGEDEDEDDADPSKKAAGIGKAGKKAKEVRYLSDDEIEGQDQTSKSGGKVRMYWDENPSSDDDDEADVEAAIAEEGVDEEVGAGGLKNHAPKIDAFNMKQEQEEGAFDEAGNYIRKAADADAVHDRWLEGVSKKEIKKAAVAQAKRDAELRQKQRENDAILTADLLKTLILKLERSETVLEALARLGKGQTKPKKIPKWKQKKKNAKNNNGEDAMDVDAEEEKPPEDPKQVKIKEAINAVTDAADKLLERDYADIYDLERERLAREYQKETGEPWVDAPKQEEEEEEEEVSSASRTWEYRWVDGRGDGAIQGPFDGPTMKAWQDAGYFGEGVEFRPVGEEDGWTRIAKFV